MKFHRFICKLFFASFDDHLLTTMLNCKFLVGVIVYKQLGHNPIRITSKLSTHLHIFTKKMMNIQKLRNAYRRVVGWLLLTVAFYVTVYINFYVPLYYKNITASNCISEVGRKTLRNRERWIQ